VNGIDGEVNGINGEVNGINGEVNGINREVNGTNGEVNGKDNDGMAKCWKVWGSCFVHKKEIALQILGNAVWWRY